jgi:tricarboxylate carrier
LNRQNFKINSEKLLLPISFSSFFLKMPDRRIDLSNPRYDQSTFEGRARHFFITTNPLNVLASDEELDIAKRIVESYRSGTEDKSLSEDEIWAAKELYDSAFHCQTGEKLFVLGRMSFQVPGNMLITGCMMTFYKSTSAVIFWQLANQSFNAIVNYTNRNASVGVSNEQLGMAYVGATTASVTTALLFNKLVASSPSLASGIVGRFVPLVAVAAANCVNIPLMRQQVTLFAVSTILLNFIPLNIFFAGN